ncbi:unnamed protein product, partial [Prorocentrum cordatum]
PSSAAPTSWRWRCCSPSGRRPSARWSKAPKGLTTFRRSTCGDRARSIQTSADQSNQFRHIEVHPGLDAGSPSAIAGRRWESPSARTPRRLRREASLAQFFAKPHVLAVCLVYVLPLGCGAAVEYAVPIVATRVMLWDASMAGGVLMAISVAVLCNQLVLMRVQSWTDEHGRVKVADCSIMFFGLAGLATTFVFTSVLWFLTVGWGATAPASARSHWLLVMGPIVLSEAWFPYLGNGVNMTFTRLVLTHVPARTSGHKRWHEHECSEVRA